MAKTRKSKHSIKLIGVSMAGLLFLGACGIKGDLETPPPLWGDKTQTPANEQTSAPANSP